MFTQDFKKGTYIGFKDGVWQIVDFQHVNPGKGSAFVRTKLKEAQSGKVVEHTFKAGEQVGDVNIETNDAEYLYNDGTNYVFMDNATYEQHEVKKEDIEDITGYLKENQQVLLLKLDGTPINIQLPKKIKLDVIQAPPGVKGDSTGSVTKTVTLETGMTVQAPLFIKEGDTLVINTETGDYVERA